MPTVPLSHASSRRTALSRMALVMALGACVGCPAAVTPPEPSTFQPLGPGQLDWEFVSAVRFDPQGLPVASNKGVRRWSVESGAWEPLGVELPARDLQVAATGDLYIPGYVLPVGTALWQRLPSLPDASESPTEGMEVAPVVDAQGNLYTIQSGGAVYLLRPRSTGWEKVEGMQGAARLALNRRGDRVFIAASGGPAAVYELPAGTLQATVSPAETMPVGFDDDGTGYSFVGNALFAVGLDGAKSRVAETSSELPHALSVCCRTPDGTFYGLASDASDATRHVVKLDPGQTKWKTLAPLREPGSAIVVRDDGLVLEYSPRGCVPGACVNELRGTGKSSHLVDALQPGIHFSPAQVTLLGGNAAVVGLTVSGASKVEDLSVTAPTGAGLTATVVAGEVPHGLAGVLRIQASADAPAGLSLVTVTSPDGASADVKVEVEGSPLLTLAAMRQHPLAEGRTMLAVKRDGTVWAWPEFVYPSSSPGPAAQVSGLWGARSVAVDTDGEGAAYAVRLDGALWVFNTAHPETAPSLVPGLSRIVAVAAGAGAAAALDASGKVWTWSSGDAAHFNVGAPGWAPPVRVSGLPDKVVALAPGFSALSDDGTVWRWPEQAPATPAQRLQGLSGVKAISWDWEARVDGSLWKGSQPIMSPNGVVDVAAHYTEQSTIKPSLVVTWAAVLSLRSDGTVWNHTVVSDKLSIPPPIPTFQIAAPPGVQAMAVLQGVQAVVTGDGAVWQSRSGVTPFERVPNLEDVRPGAPVPDFNVFGPAQETPVARGATVMLPVSVSRAGGFSGPLTVSSGALPAGFSLGSLTIPADAPSATLAVTASADAARFGPTDVAIQLSGGGLTRISYLRLSAP